MSLTFLCTAVIFFYVIIWFFDSFFKSCMHYPYYAFLEGTGFKVGMFYMSLTTTALNGLIYRTSKRYWARYFDKWYSVGQMVICFVFLPACIVLLFSVIYNLLFESVTAMNGPELQAVIPGVNVPSSDFIEYFLSLAISTVVHEYGHAVVASLEGVKLLSVGMCVVAVVPIAFVELNGEHLKNLCERHKLKIYCAGIWHNLFAAFIAFAFYYLTPLIFSFGYIVGEGVRITDIAPNSVLADPVRGIEIGDTITAINGCESNKMQAYNFCVRNAYYRQGLCLSQEYIMKNDEVVTETFVEDEVVECCSRDKGKNICFEYIESKTPRVTNLSNQYTCLTPRNVVKESFGFCSEVNGYACPKESHCLRPSLPNNTYFITIHRMNKDPVLYLGSPQDFSMLRVDEYFPRNRVFSVFTPANFEKFMRYLFFFSMGIAFINTLPCYGTDGYHITRIMFEWAAFKFHLSDKFVQFGSFFTVLLGTTLTVPLVIYLFYKVIVLETYDM